MDSPQSTPSGAVDGRARLRTGRRLRDYRVSSLFTTGDLGSIYRLRHLVDGTDHFGLVLVPEASALPDLEDRLTDFIAAGQTALAGAPVIHFTESVQVLDYVCLLIEEPPGDPLLRSTGTAHEPETLLSSLAETLRDLDASGHPQLTLHPEYLFLSPEGGVTLLAPGLLEALGPGFVQSWARNYGSLEGNAIAPEQRVGKPGDTRTTLFQFGLLAQRLFETAGVAPPDNWQRMIEGCRSAVPAERLTGWDAVLNLLREGSDTGEAGQSGSPATDSVPVLEPAIPLEAVELDDSFPEARANTGEADSADEEQPQASGESAATAADQYKEASVPQEAPATETLSPKKDSAREKPPEPARKESTATGDYSRAASARPRRKPGPAAIPASGSNTAGSLVQQGRVREKALHSPEGHHPAPPARKRGALVLLAASLVLMTGAGAAWYYLMGPGRTLSAAERLAAIEMVPPSQEAAPLRIRVEPEQATVRVSGGPTFSIRSGQLHLDGPSGPVSLTIEAEGHEERRIETYLDQAGHQIEVALEPKKVELLFETEPETRITALSGDGERFDLGLSNEKGQMEASGRLVAGDYRFEYRKPGYRPFTSPTVTLETSRATRQRQSLEALPVQLTLTSTPAGARILINGSPGGRTPVTLADVTPAVPVEISAQLEGFSPVSVRRTFEPGKAHTLDLGELQSIRIPVALAITAEGRPLPQQERARLSLTLDGRELALDALQDSGIAPGEYELRIEHPDHLPWEGRLNIRSGKLTTLAVDLQIRPAGVRVEGLYAKGDPSILLDGKPVEPDGDRIAITPGSPQEISIEVDGFQPVRRTFELEPGEEAAWIVRFEPFPAPVPGEGYAVPGTDLQLSWIQSGSFAMGSPVSETGRSLDEGPATTVTFSQGFWIGGHEVTQEDWARLMDDNPSHFQGGNRPVESISRESASLFAQRLTQREREAGRLPAGYAYRLPAEAEWEYAARQTADTGQPEPLRDVQETYAIPFNPVSTAAPSGFADNVAEWTLDDYWPALPGGPVEVGFREIDGADGTVRGASWEAQEPFRPADRSRIAPLTRSPAIGMRIALAPAATPWPEPAPLEAFRAEVLPVDSEPAWLRRPRPELPESARNLGRQIVKVRFEVDRRGKVSEMVVVHTSSAEAEESVRRTLRDWEFFPAQQDGKAVAYWTETVLEFGP